MPVGEDRAVGVDDDAGACRLTALLRFAATAEEPERRFSPLHDRGRHEHDARSVAHVDVVRREPRRVHLRGIGGRQRRSLHGGRDPLRLAQTARCGDDGEHEPAAQQGGDEGDRGHAPHRFSA